MDIRRSLMKHGSTICTVSGVLIMLAGTVLAVKATSSALEHLEEEDISEDAPKKERVVRTIKATWKDYALPATCEIVGASLIFGSHKSQLATNRQLSNLLCASDIAYRNLQDKIDEKLTKKQAAEIRDSIAEDEVKKNPPSEEMLGMYKNTYDGKHWFYDTTTGHYFRSTYEEVDKIFIKLNKKIDNELYVQKNELLIDLGEPGSSDYEKFGWETGEEVEMTPSNMDFNGEIMTAITYTKPHQLY